MSKVNASEVDDYFRQASAWDIDQVQRTKKSEKRAWIVAGMLGVIALLSVSANFTLFPLKSIEYRIVRVDEVTGMVDVQRTTLTNVKTTEKEVTDTYWLKKYVRAREGYLYDEYDMNYRTVGLLSSTPEQKKWHEFYRPENPAAPINQFGTKVRVKVKFRAVTYIGKNLANVYFTKITEQNGAPSVESYHIATVPYRYVNPPMSIDDREINPLGFQATEGYRSDPESIVTKTLGGAQ